MRPHRFAATLAALMLAATGCGSDATTLSKTPERSTEGEKAHWYESPAELAAGSPIIVHARVRKTGVGRTHTADADQKWTTRFATLEILDALKWPSSEVPAEIILEREAWEDKGVGYVVNGMTWSQVGDEGFFFLSPLDDGTYGFTSSFGCVLLNGKKRGASGLEPDRAGPWQGLASLLTDPGEATAIVHDAVRKAGAK